MSYHPVVAEIRALLEAKGVSYEFFEHAPVRTSEQAAAARPGYTLQQGAKAILARVKQAEVGKRFVMFVLPGGVPPFGHLFRLELFVDPALLAQERIAFNCGDRRASIAMTSADYRRVAGATVVELSEPLFCQTHSDPCAWACLWMVLH